MQGKVSVRTPRRGESTSSSPVPRHASTPRNPDSVSPRQTGFLLKRITEGTFGSGTTAVRKELYRKGLIVNNSAPDAALTPKGETLVATLQATMQTPAPLAATPA